MNYKTAHTKEHWVFVFEDGSTHNFGNETLTESDALMMLTARETGEIQTAHDEDTWVFCAPNCEVHRFGRGVFSETEALHIVEEFAKETGITIEEIHDMITDYR